MWLFGSTKLQYDVAIALDRGSQGFFQNVVFRTPHNLLVHPNQKHIYSTLEPRSAVIDGDKPTKAFETWHYTAMPPRILLFFVRVSLSNKCDSVFVSNQIAT